jgi:hypothetical protein
MRTGNLISYALILITPQLVARARAMRRACNQAHHGGYEIAAAAAGDTFLPAGFSDVRGVLRLCPQDAQAHHAPR